MNNERIKEKSERYFDEVARQSQIITEPQRAYPVVLKELENKKGRLVDIGCGEGNMLSAIYEAYEDSFELMGVDISGEAISRAKEKLGDKCIFFKRDVENLGTEIESVDIVLCMHSFHHYPDPYMAVKEISHIMKSGGILMIVENDRGLLGRCMRNAYYRLFNHPHGDIKVYKPTEIEGIMKKCNFLGIEHYKVTNKSYLIKGINNNR